MQSSANTSHINSWLNSWKGPNSWKGVIYRTMLFSQIFLVTIIPMNIVCFAVWEYTLPGWIYLNTDDEDGGGYLEPGNWVGSFGTFPVITVGHVLPMSSVSMGDPDEIKEGWSVRRLLVLWWCLFGSTVIISTWLGLLPWVNLVSVVRRMSRFRKIALAALIIGTPCAFWFLG